MNATRGDIVKALKAIGLNHNISPSEEVINLWCMAIGVIKKELLLKGLQRILRERKNTWFPTVGEFLNYCEEPGLSIESEAIKGFNLFLKVVTSSCTLEFKDNLIPETIRMMGGVESTRQWLTKELPFRQKEFVAIYEDLKATGLKYDPVLIGDFDEVRQIGFDEDNQLLLERKNIEKLIESEEEKQIPFTQKEATDFYRNIIDKLESEVPIQPLEPIEIKITDQQKADRKAKFAKQLEEREI